MVLISISIDTKASYSKDSRVQLFMQVIKSQRLTFIQVNTYQGEFIEGRMFFHKFS